MEGDDNKQHFDGDPSSSSSHLAQPIHDLAQFSVNEAKNSNIAGRDIIINITNVSGTSNAADERLAKESREVAVKNWLETTTKKRAEKEAGEMNILIEICRSVTPVTLQLSTVRKSSKETLDFIGHYSRKKEFADVEVNRNGNIKLRDIFAYADEVATEYAKRCTSTDAAREHCVDRHGKTVALIGQAGIGKTTLARIIVQMILNQEILPNVKYIFCVPFRSINFTQPLTFGQLILPGVNLDIDGGSITDKELLSILGDGEDVALVHDAFDEANTTALAKADPMPVGQSEVTADVYIKKLLSAELLPKAIKLITSRPRQFMEMHKDYQPSCAIDVLGLDFSAQRELCKQICKDDDAYGQVINYLQNNPDIAASCYVVAKCILIIYILNDSIIKCGSINIESITDIFVRVLNIYIRSPHMRGKENNLKKLAALAMKGLQEGRIAFTEEDFEDVGIASSDFEAFLVTFGDEDSHIKVRLLDGDLVSYFSHLIWQELFSAIHLLFFSSPEDFESAIVHLHESRWEVVAKFVYGMCNANVHRQIKKIFKIRNDTIWETRKNELKDLVLKRMKNVGSDNTEELLTLCSWLHEIKDDKVNLEVLHHLPDNVNLTGLIIHTDIPSLTYVLKCAKKCISITTFSSSGALGFIGYPYQKMQRTQFSHGCFEAFLKALVGVKLKCLKLCQTFHENQCKLLVNLIPEIDGLYLASFNGSLRNILFISNAIQQRPAAITYLDLSSSQIRVQEMKYIALTLQKLRCLSLEHCGITAHEVKTLSEACRQSPFPVQLVNLSNNWIGNAGASALASCLHNIDQLKLSRCGLTSEGVIELAKSYCALEKPATSLNICHNVIGKAAFDFMGSGLMKVGEVTFSQYVVSNTDILEDGQLIAKEIPFSNLYIPLVQKSVSLQSRTNTGTTTGDVKSAVLSLCLHQLDEVRICNLKLTSMGMWELAFAIELRTNVISVVDLSQNQVDSKGIEHIASALHKIDQLILRECAIGEEGIKALAEACKIRPTQMELLDLSYNYIQDRGASELGKALHNIKCLNLCGCDLTSKSFIEIAQAYQLLGKAAKSLNICHNAIGKAALDVLAGSKMNVDKITCGIYEVTSDRIYEKWQRNVEEMPVSIVTISSDVKSFSSKEGFFGARVSGNVKAAILSLCLDQLNEIKVHDYSLTCIGISEIACALQHRSTALTELDVSQCQVRNEGAKHIASALHKIDRLKLAFCEITEEGVKVLADTCNQRSTPISELDISSNQIGKEGVQHIASVLHKIDRLKLRASGITQHDMIFLRDACKQRSSPLALLDLSKNNITDEGSIVLAEAIHNIVHLNLSECALTSIGITALAEACQMVEINKPSLNICYNVVGKEAFDSLDKCMTKNIHELTCSQHKVTSDCVQRVGEITVKELMTSSIVIPSDGTRFITSSTSKDGDMIAAVLSLGLHKLKVVELSNCSMTFVGVRELAYAIKQRNYSMTLVDLSGNRIGDSGAKHIATALHKIDGLKLVECEITHDGIKDLAEACKQRQTPMTVFDVSINKIGDHGANCIASALQKIDQLKLCYCSIEKDGLTAITNACNQLKTRMTSLNLLGNRIGELKEFAPVQGFHKVDRLDLSGCGLTSEDFIKIAAVFQDLKTSTKSFKLRQNVFGKKAFDTLTGRALNVTEANFSQYKVTSYGVQEVGVIASDKVPSPNTIVSCDVKYVNLYRTPNNLTGDVAAAVFSLCLHQLVELKLLNCSLSSVGIQELSYALQQRKKAIDKLDLSGNRISDQGVEHIASVLPKTKRLKLFNCRITPHGAQLLAEACKECTNRMAELDLSFNRIGEQGMGHVAAALHKVERLKLKGCGITPDMIKTFSKMCSLPKTKLVFLDLSDNYIGNLGASALASCLHNIDHLDLSGCRLTSDGIIEVYRSLRKPIKSLKLCRNALGKAAIDYMICQAALVEEYTFSRYMMTINGPDEDGDMITRRMPRTNTSLPFHIKSVTIDHCSNDFTGDMKAAVLSLCLHQLHEVKMCSNSSLTRAGVVELAYSIKQRTSQLSSLDLSGNKIGNAGASALGEAVHNINHLNLSECGLSSEGIIQLANAFQVSKNLVKSLNICHNAIGKAAFDFLAKTPIKVDEITFTQYIVTFDEDAQTFDQFDDVQEDGEHTVKQFPTTNVKMDSSGVHSSHSSSHHLNNNVDIKAAALSLCLQQLNKMNIPGGVTSIGYWEMSYAMKQRASPMTTIYISCYMTEEAAMHIASMLHKTDQLKLRSCHATENVIKTLSEACKQRETPLKKLSMRGMKLEDQKVQHIASALHNIKRLTLNICNISSNGIKILTETCKNLTTPITKFSMEYNDFDDQGWKHIASALNKIDRLKLTLVTITQEGFEALAEACKQRSQPMIELDIRLVLHEVRGLEHVASALYNIDCLRLIRCSIPHEGINALADACKQRMTSMAELSLRGCSEVCNEGAKHIATAIHKIDQLDVAGCGITEDGIVALIEAYKQRETPMKKLDISCNDVGVQGMECITSALDKIDKLNLTDCNISPDGIRALTEACKQRATPMHFLDLSGNNFGDTGASLLAECMQYVKELVVSMYDLPDTEMKVLESAAAKLNRSQTKKNKPYPPKIHFKC